LLVGEEILRMSSTVKGKGAALVAMCQD